MRAKQCKLKRSTPVQQGPSPARQHSTSPWTGGTLACAPPLDASPPSTAGSQSRGTALPASRTGSDVRFLPLKHTAVLAPLLLPAQYRERSDFTPDWPPSRKKGVDTQTPTLCHHHSKRANMTVPCTNSVCWNGSGFCPSVPSILKKSGLIVLSGDLPLYYLFG